jgi:hypothetical protein
MCAGGKGWYRDSWTATAELNAVPADCGLSALAQVRATGADGTSVRRVTFQFQGAVSC